MNKKKNNKKLPDKSLGDIKQELLLSVKSGILSEDSMHQIMMEAERNYYLKMHPYAVTYSTSGLWMTYLPSDGAKGGRVKRKSKDKKIIEDIIIDYWKDQVVQTMGSLILEWLNHKREIGLRRNKFKRQTYDRYMTDFHRFFDNTEMIAQDVSSLTSIELEDFIIERIETLDLTAKAYSGLRILLRGSLNYYARRNRLSFSPESFFAGIDLRGYFADGFKKSQCFTNAEIQQIKHYINVHTPSAVSYGILFGFYTGLRIGELSALRWEDVSEHSIYIHATEERYRGENGEYLFRVRNDPKTTAGVRYVILTPQANDILNKMKELNPDGEYVFMHNGNRIKGDTYTNKLLRICRTLKIEQRSMHKVRKTYASNLFKARVDEALIIDQMGHIDIKTTKEFYRWNVSEDEESRSMIYKAINY